MIILFNFVNTFEKLIFDNIVIKIITKSEMFLYKKVSFKKSEPKLFIKQNPYFEQGSYYSRL